MEQRMISEDTLAHLLRQAESAHADFERTRGHPDDNWPGWYAHFIFAHLPPGDGVERSTEPYIAG